MNQSDDYKGEVMNTMFADQDVERILAGQTPDNPDLTDLAEFVTALRSYRTVAPSIVALERMAAEAAGVVRNGLAADVGIAREASPLRPGRRHSWTHVLVAAAAGLVLLLGIGGVAVAADDAAPGDALYGIDLALENIGVGDGGADERIAEAQALFAAGLSDEAFALLTETLEEALENLDDEAAAKVERHIELAATKPEGSQAQESQLKVAELKAFIETNKGKGIGLDGEEFGQGVAEIARGGGEEDAAAADSEESDGPGPPENAGPKPGRGNAPDHAGR